MVDAALGVVIVVGVGGVVTSGANVLLAGVVVVDASVLIAVAVAGVGIVAASGSINVEAGALVIVASVVVVVYTLAVVVVKSTCCGVVVLEASVGVEAGNGLKCSETTCLQTPLA